MQHILCVDMGGTNCRFAYFLLENQDLTLAKLNIVSTLALRTHTDAASLLHMGAHSLGLSLAKVDFCLVGMAGPIESNGLCGQLTNVSLSLDFSSLPNIKLGENFLLVNDFALQAWASLSPEVDLETILPTPKENSPQSTPAIRAIVGAGTGLGTALLVPTHKGQWKTLSAEGGHVDMPFWGSEEVDFMRFALEHLQQERLSAEDILAARGLSLLHAYVHGNFVSAQEAAEKMLTKDAHGKESVPLQLYARFLGRFCRHFALQTLCKGGLYIGGGVLTKNSAILQSPSFTKEFYNVSPKMQNSLLRLPIFLMKHAHASLWGAAQLAKHCLENNHAVAQ